MISSVALPFYSNNATSISQRNYTPNNFSFKSVWQYSINNVRFNVVVTPVDESQVRTVLYCAQKQCKIQRHSHDFEGLSYTNPSPLPFVMIDMINMRSIEIDVNGKTAWVQGEAILWGVVL